MNEHEARMQDNRRLAKHAAPKGWRPPWLVSVIVGCAIIIAIRMVFGS